MIKIAREPWSDFYGVLITQNVAGKTFVGRPVEIFFEPLEEGAMVEPTFRLSDDDVRELADGLDALHVKTENIHKIEGVLEATKVHLEDMRKLVFAEPTTEVRVAWPPRELKCGGCGHWATTGTSCALNGGNR